MKKFFLLCFISLLSHAEFIDQNTTTYSKVKSYCDNNQYKYCSEYKIEYLNFADDNFNEILKQLYKKTFNKFYKQNPQNDVKEMLSYNPERDLEIYQNIKFSFISSTNSTLTIQKEINSYTGGAHGSDVIEFLNYDTNDNKLIKLSDLFDIKKLKPILENFYKKSHNIQDLTDDGWFENSFKIAEQFAITKDGILFYYNSYEIKPYAYGHTKLLVPYSILKPAIKNNILNNL